mmetsp:Transcript_29463/g.93801  ORF Transcript_29463/g.93801 Transcript_29463/m.93801 type:complete len:247 (+) Transcript_29463:103-843(+)
MRAGARKWPWVGQCAVHTHRMHPICIFAYPPPSPLSNFRRIPDFGNVPEDDPSHSNCTAAHYLRRAIGRASPRAGVRAGFAPQRRSTLLADLVLAWKGKGCRRGEGSCRNLPAVMARAGEAFSSTKVPLRSLQPSRPLPLHLASELHVALATVGHLPGLGGCPQIAPREPGAGARVHVPRPRQVFLVLFNQLPHRAHTGGHPRRTPRARARPGHGPEHPAQPASHPRPGALVRCDFVRHMQSPGFH